MANGCTNLSRKIAQGVATEVATATGAAFLMTNDNEEDAEENTEETMFSFNMTDESVCIEKKHLINLMWIIPDSASTVKKISNRKLLKNIRDCGSIRGLRIYTNGGTQDTHLIGDLPGFGPVWYNKGSLANILSLAAVRKTSRISYSNKEAAIIVHKKNGDELKFKETGGGLYYYTIKPTNQNIIDYTFAQTIAQNKLLFTKR